MKGLIIKDLFNLARQNKVMGILIGFYIVLALTMDNISMLEGVLTIMGVILLFTTMSYDEKARWDKYALSMPISRRDMVLSKYFLGIMLVIAAFILNIAFGIATSPDAPMESFTTAIVLLALGLLYISLVLPVLFKWGVEKGRFLMMLILFLPAAFMTVYSKLGLNLPGEETLNRLVLASPFVILLVVAASMAVSINIFARKEM